MHIYYLLILLPVIQCSPDSMPPNYVWHRSYQNLNLGMSSGLGNLGSSYLGGGSYNFNTNYQSSYNNYQSLLPNAVLPSSSLPSGNYNNMFDDSDTKKKGKI